MTKRDQLIIAVAVDYSSSDRYDFCEFLVKTAHCTSGMRDRVHHLHEKSASEFLSQAHRQRRSQPFMCAFKEME